MAQNGVENNYYLNQFNDPLDNIFVEQGLNSTDINKSLLDNKNQTNSPSSNSQKNINFFQNGYMGGNYDGKNTRFKKYNQSQNNNNINKRKTSYNQSIGNTTPNRSFLTRSKLSINSKNNSSYKNINRKNSGSNLSFKSNLKLRNNSQMVRNNNNFMKKDPNKEAFILGKLTEEVEHIKNYCNELQRQFDNHCLIKNEKKEFENIKKENIKLTAEVSILKDDVAELMKKFSLINNKIDSMQQENNNLRMQNKNLLNFISIMNNSSSGGLKKFKTFNMNQTSDNSLLNINNNYNNIDNVNNQDLFSHNNNESMNIINLINNNRSNNRSNTYMDLNNNNNIKRNSNVNSINNNNINNSNKNISYMSNTNYNFHNNNTNNNLINNLNSDQIDFSISKSMSKNFDKIQIQDQIKDKNYLTCDNFDNRSNYMNINSNTITYKQNNIQTQYKTIGNMGQGSKNMGDNATDIASLIQSNFNLTKQVRNESNNKNKQNRYLIPKNED
jgi:hypothetical protein